MVGASPGNFGLGQPCVLACLDQLEPQFFLGSLFLVHPLKLRLKIRPLVAALRHDPA
jgi:hypothetical protein